MPVITPVPAFSDRPAGSVVPLKRVHAYAPFPPVAVRVWLYAIPTVPFGRDVVVIVMTG